MNRAMGVALAVVGVLLVGGLGLGLMSAGPRDRPIGVPVTVLPSSFPSPSTSDPASTPTASPLPRAHRRIRHGGPASRSFHRYVERGGRLRLPEGLLARASPLLESGVRSQRRMLDDAGHELRTPITILQGHLELMDPGDAADAAATRELALDELERMRRLVEGLIALAKVEAPDFVRPEPTDLEGLAAEALDKARPLGDREWRLRTAGPLVAEVDPQRITQALLQPADNAVKCSEVGTVDLRGRAR